MLAHRFVLSAMILGGFISGCALPRNQALHVANDGGSTVETPLHLFNGRDLEGFYTYLQDRGRDNDPNGVFTVRDGVIRISGAEWGCITTREEYDNYLLVVEYRWGERTWPPREQKTRDSGILMHSVGRDGAYHGAWMYSIECNVIEGGTGDFIVVGDGSPRFALTASVRKGDTARGYVYDPTEKGNSATIHEGRIDWRDRDPDWTDVKGFRGKSDVERPLGEWNRLECLAIADHIVIKLNGQHVNSCRDVQPCRGRIQIQSEGAELFVRRFDLIPMRGDPQVVIKRFLASAR